MIVLFGEARSPDIYYRCKWNSEVDVLYVEDEKSCILYVPGFEYARARSEVTSVEVRKLEDPVEIVKNLPAGVTIPSRFPYVLGKELKDPVVTREVFLERRVKKEDEIEEIARVQRITHSVINRVVERISHARLSNGVLHEGETVLTSEMLKAFARGLLIEKGLDCPDMIIASGAQTAQPHNRGSGPIVEGPVIIDIFPQDEQRRYWGDMTRTVIVGEHLIAQNMLEVVKAVHDLCVDKCVPGMSCSELHELAASELEKRGFKTDEETGFIHSLGHSVGLAIHESPNLSPREEGVLEKGMVVTIEPGLYYDVGVRFENIIVVGDEPRIL